jgi:hypothetical protein
VRALALPFAVIIVVVVLRRPLGDFFRNAGGSVNKLAFGWFSIEFATVGEVQPDWKVNVLGHLSDVRQLTTAEDAS